jgi:diaminopimelate decarboxylase
MDLGLEATQTALTQLADKIGTPFYFYDAASLREKLAALGALTEGTALQCRYAMKANSARQILNEVRAAGLWIDAVSGNEVLRALRAGFAGGSEPPVVMLTTDVFRDNALTTVLEHGVLPNVGSPGMIRELRDAGYRGPIALRINPGFGHGHVKSCDTGGPSSKHGVWYEEVAEARRLAADARYPIVALHAHVGTGPELREFDANMRKLVDFYDALLPQFPDARAVNLGGGLPHPYRPGAKAYDLAWYRPVLLEAASRLAKTAGHPVRIEIEPGRYPVAGMGYLVARVKDVKKTRENSKGPGNTFVMVDAGFTDLVRPAMYGSYHHMSVVGAGARNPAEPVVVAGPLCESGDVFTRDDRELLDPRSLPRPEPGDLLVLHDAGAYGAAMSSNYVSMGRVPQVFWDNGQARLIARRETVEDIVRNECDESL